MNGKVILISIDGMRPDGLRVCGNPYVSELERIASGVRNKLRVVLGLDAKVKLESPNTLQRFEGKAKRIKDLRNI